MARGKQTGGENRPPLVLFHSNRCSPDIDMIGNSGRARGNCHMNEMGTLTQVRPVGSVHESYRELGRH
jgi:hypothetical protein